MIFIPILSVIMFIYFIGLFMYMTAIKDTETQKFLKENNLWKYSKWLWPIVLVKTLYCRLSKYIRDLDRYGGG